MDNNIQTFIEKVISEYPIDVQVFHNRPSQRCFTEKLNDSSKKNCVTITDSINDIVSLSLKNITKPKPSMDSASNNCSSFVIPDVHGKLDLLLQLLYNVGIIDSNGLYKKRSKGTRDITFLGDYISKGPNSWETYIYLKSLKKQAKNFGDTINLLCGNHEMYILNNLYQKSETDGGYSEKKANMLHRDIFRSVLQTDVLKGDLIVSHSIPNSDILLSHAPFEKAVMIKIINEILKQKCVSLKIPSNIDEKTGELNHHVPNVELSKVCNFYNITTRDIVKYTNNVLMDSVKNNDFNNFIFNYGTYFGILESAQKALRSASTKLARKNSKENMPLFTFESTLPYKALYSKIITGHSLTAFDKPEVISGSRCAYNMHLCKGRCIFVDSGMVYGKASCVGINSNMDIISFYGKPVVPKKDPSTSTVIGTSDLNTRNWDFSLLTEGNKLPIQIKQFSPAKSLDC